MATKRDREEVLDKELDLIKVLDGERLGQYKTGFSGREIMGFLKRQKERDISSLLPEKVCEENQTNLIV